MDLIQRDLDLLQASFRSHSPVAANERLDPLFYSNSRLATRTPSRWKPNASSAPYSTPSQILQQRASTAGVPIQPAGDDRLHLRDPLPMPLEEEEEYQHLYERVSVVLPLPPVRALICNTVFRH